MNKTLAVVGGAARIISSTSLGLHSISTRSAITPFIVHAFACSPLVACELTRNVTMSKRPNVYKPYMPPQKVAKEDTAAKEEKKPEKKEEDQAEIFSLPEPAFATLDNQSSESENDEPGPSNRLGSAFHPKNSLKVSNDSFKVINTFIDRVSPKIRSREHFTHIHDSIVQSLNQGSSPSCTRISEHPPAPPPGTNFGLDFTTAYQAKARTYSRRLAAQLANEYKRLAREASTSIQSIVEEAESTLCLIDDEADRSKALKLFNIKLKAVNRRISTENRRPIKGKRRFTK